MSISWKTIIPQMKKLKSFCYKSQKRETKVYVDPTDPFCNPERSLDCEEVLLIILKRS